MMTEFFFLFVTLFLIVCAILFVVRRHSKTGVVTGLPLAFSMVGFCLSAVTVFLFMGDGMIAPFALLLYPLSLLFRGTGWYLLGKKYSRVFYITAFAVFGIGYAAFAFLMNSISIEGSARMPPQFFLLSWASYSIIEALSYYQIKRRFDSRFPLLAFLSIPVIVLVLVGGMLNAEILLDNKEFFLPLLIISSVAVAIGFARLKSTNREAGKELNGS